MEGMKRVVEECRKAKGRKGVVYRSGNEAIRTRRKGEGTMISYSDVTYDTSLKM
jgi:hypothetical protein